MYKALLILALLGLLASCRAQWQPEDTEKDTVESGYSDEEDKVAAKPEQNERVKGGDIWDRILEKNQSSRQDSSPTVNQILTLLQRALLRIRSEVDQLLKRVREPVQEAVQDVQKAMQHPHDALFKLLVNSFEIEIEPAIKCGKDASPPKEDSKDQEESDPCQRMTLFCSVTNKAPTCDAKSGQCQCVNK